MNDEKSVNDRLGTSTKLTRRSVLTAAGVGTMATLAAGLQSPSASASETPREVCLVKDGQARCAIVLEEPESQFVVDAANELQHHVLKATGVQLDIINQGEPTGQRVSIHIGRGRLADALIGQLEPEQFWIKAFGNKILIVGGDIDYATSPLPFLLKSGGYYVRQSPATLWAVGYLLDRYFGVRWLWPGEEGAYVPRTDTLSIPEMEVTDQPAMLSRQLRSFLAKYRLASQEFLSDAQLQHLNDEMFRWLGRHQMGTRVNVNAAHSFTTWWDEYSADHPDYFAETPAGYEQPWPEAGRVKLRIGNPAVADQVLQEWQAAGAPDYYNVAPNDSTGFDISDASRALDFPPNQPVLDIWLGHANLSTRYVKFWNSLLTRMKEINPNAHLQTYFYSAYMSAPPVESGVTVHDGIIGGFVAYPWSQDDWRAWSSAGANLYLRPNWWDYEAGAPALALHREGGFFTFSCENGSVGFDFDSIIGYWGTQGLRYYMIARLSSRPDLTVDDVIDEFASAFGAAAPAIRDYVGYWESFTESVSYPRISGDDPDGLYAMIIQEHGLSTNISRGSFQIIPYLYTDEVLATARAFLDAASALADDEDAAVTARIDFLRDGLAELEKVRDVMQLGYADRGSAEFLQAAGELKQMRVDLTERHVVWGEVAYWWEDRFDIPTFAVS